MTLLSIPITTSEQLEKYYKDRVARECLLSPEDLDADHTDLAEKLTAIRTLQNMTAQALEETKALHRDAMKYAVGMTYGLPFEISGRLKGDTLQEIRADAEAIAPDFAPRQVMPIGSPEPVLRR